MGSFIVTSPDALPNLLPTTFIRELLGTFISALYLLSSPSFWICAVADWPDCLEFKADLDEYKKVEEYDGIVGLYAGEVGLYDGEVGLYDGEVGLYDGEVGLYDGEVGLYDGEVGLYDGEVGLYDGEVGLYDGEVGLYDGEVGRKDTVFEDGGGVTWTVYDAGGCERGGGGAEIGPLESDSGSVSLEAEDAWLTFEDDDVPNAEIGSESFELRAWRE